MSSLKPHLYKESSIELLPLPSSKIRELGSTN